MFNALAVFSIAAALLTSLAIAVVTLVYLLVVAYYSLEYYATNLANSLDKLT
jgi:hypothetical protein